MSALLAAMVALGDRLMEAEAIGDALDSVAVDESYPPVVHVFRSQLRAIRGASEELEALIRGIGGVAPDGDKVLLHTPGDRGTGGGLPGSPLAS